MDARLAEDGRMKSRIFRQRDRLAPGDVLAEQLCLGRVGSGAVDDLTAFLIGVDDAGEAVRGRDEDSFQFAGAFAVLEFRAGLALAVPEERAVLQKVRLV